MIRERSVEIEPGVHMPLLGLGTWQARGEAVERAVRYALELGYRHVDTALMYGNEREVGRALSASSVARGEVFVTTNCFGTLGKSPESLMCHFSRCIQKIDGRLRYYPCPVIYDDERFDLGSTLEESFRRVYIAHKNCYDYCMKGSGASCRTHTI